jgi:CubicO group peptidase (beta-lactamase class C family)
MIKNILRYFTYLVLFLLGILLILLIYPKGSLETQLKNRNVPAIGYAIIEGGELVESKVVGDLEKGVEAPENAIFNVASVTKPVFATMALKLIDAGVLGLDEPVYPYWVDPDIADDERHKQLTPRILLSHQAGFPNWRWFNEDGKLSFWHEPGTTFHYSGEGMEYLKRTLENKTGKGLNELMDSIIFQPLGMKDSRLIWDSLLHEERLAKFHNREGELYEIRKRTNPVASDDLCITPDELAKFALHIIEDQGGLSETLYDEMTRMQVNMNERTGYGLGWQLVEDLPGGEYALIHGGSDEGVRARIVVLPKSKTAFIAFVNGDNGQQIIDRLMVKKLKLGGKILDHIYTPFIWRIIYLPFNLPF